MKTNQEFTKAYNSFALNAGKDVVSEPEDEA